MMLPVDRITGKLYSLRERYHRSIAKPNYFIGIAGILMILSLCHTYVDGMLIHLRVGQPAEAYAQAIEKAPDMWRSMADEARKNKTLSEYGYRLEIQRIAILRSRSDALAAQLREWKEEEWGKFKLGQALQVVTGGAAGKCAGRYVAKPAVDAIKAANDAFYISKGIAERAYEGRSPEERLSSIWRELFKTIEEAQATSDEKLLVANFSNLIHGMRNWIENNHPTDTQYKAELARRAAKFIHLTRAGGSKDSKWANVDELIAWLSGYIGREIKDKEEVDTSTLPLSEGDFFQQSDFNTIKQSTPITQEESKEISQPPSENLGPGGIALLCYGGIIQKPKKDNREPDEIGILTCIAAFENSDQAENAFKQEIALAKSDIPNIEERRRQKNCEEGYNVGVKSTSNLYVQTEPTCKHGIWVDGGSCTRCLLYQNTVIMSAVGYTQPLQSEALALVQEWENRATKVVDDALERARNRHSVPIT